jgi:hypothetical protein
MRELAVVAVAQLALALPALLLGQDHSAPVHVAHEMDSLDVAVAVGFFVAARRPSRAIGMLGLVGVAAAMLVLTAGIDLGIGRTDLLDEAPHLAVVVGWVLLRRLALLAPPSGDRPISLFALWQKVRAVCGGHPGRRFGEASVATGHPGAPATCVCWRVEPVVARPRRMQRPRCHRRPLPGRALTVRDTCPYFPVAGSRRPVDAVIS